MSEKILAAIIELIASIPGIQGIASIDQSKSNQALAEEDWAKGVTVTEGAKGGIDISIALVVKRDVSSKIIAKEIDSAIRIMAKQTKAKVDNINIYVRGVK